jgi:hypothetical protein
MRGSTCRKKILADRLLLVCCGLVLAVPALAEEEEMPDSAFLEYLGMWEETDEEWLLHEQMEEEAAETRSGPAAESKDSPENDDES